MNVDDIENQVAKLQESVTIKSHSDTKLHSAAELQTRNVELLERDAHNDSKIYFHD